MNALPQRPKTAELAKLMVKPKWDKPPIEAVDKAVVKPKVQQSRGMADFYLIKFS